MVLDCDNYRVNVSLIKALMDPKTEQERMEFIGRAAVITGVPVIIVSCYAGELYGFSEPLKKLIDRLKLFYKVDEVLNIREVTANEVV